MDFDILNAPDGRPSLECSIEPAINLHVERAEQHTWEWAVEIGLVHGEGLKYERFVAARFPWLAARAYPKVDAEQLELISDWITFLFFYDDMCDTQAATEPSYLEKLVAREDRLIALAFGAELDESDSPLDRALVDILTRVAARSVGFWQLRLANHIEEYIEGCRWERIIRAQGRIPRLATYSKLRPLISAVFPCFDFAGICIDGQHGEFARSVHVQQLEVMANNYICWVNDIYGLDKELGEQTTSNLVIVLAHQHDLTWDQAIDRAIDMCNAELEAFVELERQLEQLGDPDCQAYVRSLEAWMRGNLDWYSETHRYRRDGEQAMAACWSTWTRWSMAGTE
ncbi:terpene synthase family protein [Nannocystaceae bacterium ST9]